MGMMISVTMTIVVFAIDTTISWIVLNTEYRIIETYELLSDGYRITMFINNLYMIKTVITVNHHLLYAVTDADLIIN